jgi:hypothetical protein
MLESRCFVRGISLRFSSMTKSYICWNYETWVQTDLFHDYFCYVSFGIRTRIITVSFSIRCIYNNMLCNSLLTYAIISWWCRIHAFNLGCESQFTVVWTCPSSCPWWGVTCSCPISNMAAFSFSNWVQATAMNVVTRDGKPQVIPSSWSVVKHCKNANTDSWDVLKWAYWGMFSELIAAKLLILYKRLCFVESL